MQRNKRYGRTVSDHGIVISLRALHSHESGYKDVTFTLWQRLCADVTQERG
jgi:hypothetical protein